MNKHSDKYISSLKCEGGGNINIFAQRNKNVLRKVKYVKFLDFIYLYAYD